MPVCHKGGRKINLDSITLSHFGTGGVPLKKTHKAKKPNLCDLVIKHLPFAFCKHFCKLLLWPWPYSWKKSLASHKGIINTITMVIIKQKVKNQSV